MLVVSEDEDEREMAALGLWTLAFATENRPRIIQEPGLVEGNEIMRCDAVTFWQSADVTFSCQILYREGGGGGGGECVLGDSFVTRNRRGIRGSNA